MPENGEEAAETIAPDPGAVEGEKDPTVDEDAASEEVEGSLGRLRNFAKRLIDWRDLAEDTRDLMWAVVSTSDKAKTEMVRMVAREVRTYLDELRLKDDLLKMMRNHSLEVSIKLKPIADSLDPSNAEDPAEE